MSAIYPMPLLDIPESWETVEDFGDWYVKNGMPFIPPGNFEVFLTDDATAICMFRHGQFQIELYLIHPEPIVQLHEHPGVEVMKVEVDQKNKTYSTLETVREGMSHGAGRRLDTEQGFPLIAVQHWVNGMEPATVAAAWKGRTAGPLHDALIRRFFPDAMVLNGYADVTRTMEDAKRLAGVA